MSEPTEAPDEDVVSELDEDDLDQIDGGGGDFGALPPELNSGRMLG
jgi:hypothetical protein